MEHDSYSRSRVDKEKSKIPIRHILMIKGKKKKQLSNYRIVTTQYDLAPVKVTSNIYIMKITLRVPKALKIPFFSVEGAEEEEFPNSAE